MHNLCKNRIQELRSRMAGCDIDIALITDDDTVYYFSGYYDYLHMEFGSRPSWSFPGTMKHS